MKESQIRKKVIERLKQDNWISWFAPKAKFQESDIFGIWDIIAIRNNQLRFIQLTTYSNISARRHKIQAFTIPNKAVFPMAEIWGWHNDKKEFKIVQI